ncbi:uncharacterized protein LOC111331078 isoform X2 [Stylophora pistillata]|uniref:uncharacterized protein LOC111331078 isoform X2 n=1 Tax=Stylophora pistillata TaxID=50429 RepID=UPI000C04BCB5|nr:uncharacterized protein LOC111331078 isoform X2 [Stylophora pistillata]
MSELRQYSLQQSKSLRWISILLAAILIAVGIHSYVLIRRDCIEQSLSTELKEMRKMVEELSSKVAKTEAENENLREELSNTEISRLRRSNLCHTGHRKHKNHSNCCHSFERCMKRHKTAEEGLNCTSVRKCQPKAFMHMSTIILGQHGINGTVIHDMQSNSVTLALIRSTTTQQNQVASRQRTPLYIRGLVFSLFESQSE